MSDNKKTTIETTNNSSETTDNNKAKISRLATRIAGSSVRSSYSKDAGSDYSLDHPSHPEINTAPTASETTDNNTINESIDSSSAEGVPEEEDIPDSELPKDIADTIREIDLDTVDIEDIDNLSEDDIDLLITKKKQREAANTKFVKKTDSTGRTVDYVVVDKLPSHFRSYPHIEQVFVRGLNLSEALQMSKLIDTTAKLQDIIPDLANIYSETIKGIDIYDLELVDFTILNIISSIWTVDGFGWSPNIPCAHSNEDGTRCPGIITDRIVLDDFHFQEPNVTKLPIEIMLGPDKVPVGALTVKDMIDKKRLLESNIFDEDKDILSKLIDYALLIKNGRPLDERVNMIRYAQKYELKELYEISEDIYIKLDLIPKTCPVCKKTTHLKITLNQIRGYP